PTENYAIKTGVHPAIVTKQNTENFKRQIKMLGTSFDWSREINTTDPKYYKWTQWIFLQLYKKGLAYKEKKMINWCPKDKIGLANEEVINGNCERCGSPVEKREKEQWILAITKYADRLYDDLDSVDYLERIKIQQRNWIGKSEGAEIEFKVVGARLLQETGSIKVFTTRADTLFGATYVVLAPEHELVEKLKIENKEEVVRYIVQTKKKTEIERTTDTKIKTGVELKGIKAINPANNEELPIWIADYVLASYGTGAIMAVPAQDERDFEFAKKYNLPIKEKFVENNSIGKKVTTYKLRDWIFSRQRYWGEPIPMINCNRCGWIPVPEKDLPVILPEVENYTPTDTGESPLANIAKWVKT
ncbi:MAG: class I tRNA ligase family protein, partial [Patescibacteria group bacterium]